MREVHDPARCVEEADLGRLLVVLLRRCDDQSANHLIRQDMGRDLFVD